MELGTWSWFLSGPNRTQGGPDGRATALTAGSHPAGGEIRGVVLVAAIDSHWFVDEGVDIVKDASSAGV